MTAAGEEIEQLARRLRLPHLRRQAADVLATAKAQRWDPTETLRVLLEVEIEGRDASMVEKRRRRARFPTGKTFDSFETERCSIPSATQSALRTLEWIERKENLVVCGPSDLG